MEAPATATLNPQATSALSRWWLVVVLSVAALTSYSDRLILSALVDPIRQDLGLTDLSISLLQGAVFAIVYVLAGLPLGRLADRTRRVNLLIAGSITWSLGTIACGYASQVPTLAIARLIVGIGEAALAPAAVSLLADNFPASRRGVPMGILFTAMIVGGPVGVAAGGLILQSAETGALESVTALRGLAPWRTVMLIVGASGLIVPVLCLTLREPSRRHIRSRKTPLGEAIAQFASRRRLLVPVYVGMALLSIGDYGILSWVPALLTRHFHWTPALAGTWFGAICIVASITGSFGGGVLFDQVSRQSSPGQTTRILVIAAMIGAFGAGFLATPFAALSLTGLAFWMMGSNMAGVVGMTLVQSAVPGEIRGTAIALIAFCNTLLGLGCGPSIVALITEHVYRGPQYVGYAMATAIVPAAVGAVVLFRRAGRAEPSIALR